MIRDRDGEPCIFKRRCWGRGDKKQKRLPKTEQYLQHKFQWHPLYLRTLYIIYKRLQKSITIDHTRSDDQELDGRFCLLCQEPKHCKSTIIQPEQNGDDSYLNAAISQKVTPPTKQIMICFTSVPLPGWTRGSFSSKYAPGIKRSASSAPFHPAEGESAYCTRRTLSGA